MLGIGNPLRRDDGAGLWVAERLRGTGWEVIPAGQGVENALGVVRRLAPDLLVIVDAAEMGLPPGSVRRLPVEGAGRMLGSTHALPLPFLLGTVWDAVGKMVLIGIQPADRSLGEGLTPAVQVGAEALVALLRAGDVEAVPPMPLPARADRPQSPPPEPRPGSRGARAPRSPRLSTP
ncbi:MAG TPA: hydrogenase 3 maturation endopeptidase HyCI [Candidatus Acetothermia bacterium]|nr:hydrogenase 3 maturation endopeptidase HyCI [Candidatus Acetothermia bacterium]